MTKLTPKRNCPLVNKKTCMHKFNTVRRTQPRPTRLADHSSMTISTVRYLYRIFFYKALDKNLSDVILAHFQHNSIVAESL